MALRPLRSATGVHLEDLAVLIGHLKSDPRATELVGDAEAASAALKAQHESWNAQHHAVKEVQSSLANIDETLHSAVRVAHLAILDDVRNNRRDPKFLTYFPRGLVGIFTAAYVDELQAVRSLAERCAQDSSPKIQEQADVLRGAADQMEAALDRRTKAMLAESVSYGQLQVEKLLAVDTCRRTGHRLTELYPAERDRVRSYFRPTRRRARSTAPATDNVAPATEGSATDASAPATAALATSTPVPPTLVLTSAAADL
jgi:hypothetical protein